MPILREDRERYPRDWPDLSRYIREERSGGRCECQGECGRRHATREGRCVELDGTIAVTFQGTVALTVGHRNHTPEDNRGENLAAWCQGCHLRHDAGHHARRRTLHRWRNKVRWTRPLFGA